MVLGVIPRAAGRKTLLVLGAFRTLKAALKGPRAAAARAYAPATPPSALPAAAREHASSFDMRL
jgi:hypothetical protein